MTIRADAEDGDNRGTMVLNFGGQPPPAGNEIISRKFGGRRRGERDDIAEADAALQQFTLFERRHQSTGKSGFVERRPEPISRPCEMMADGRRVETRID